MDVEAPSFALLIGNDCPHLLEPLKLDLQRQFPILAGILVSGNPLGSIVEGTRDYIYMKADTV